MSIGFKPIIMIILCLGIGLMIRLIYENKKQQESIKYEQAINIEKNKIDFIVSSDSMVLNKDIDTTLNDIQNDITEESNPIESSIEEIKIEPKEVKREEELYQKPFYIISISAYSQKYQALKEAKDLKNEGLSGNFMWIPDYQEGGKKLYKVYIGPFKNKNEASNARELVKDQFKGCYVQTIK